MKHKRTYECLKCNQEFEEPAVDTLGMKVCPNCGYSGILPTEKSVAEKIPDMPPIKKKSEKKITRPKTRQLKFEM
jgi:DNA-directed RNA polymerase subunit RPC12/RpoP